MENEEKKMADQAVAQPDAEQLNNKTANATHVVTADSVQAEEIPTIPVDSLQIINALHPEVTVHSVASMKSESMPTPLVVQPAEYRRSMNEWLQIWCDGMRTEYLPLALMPVILGGVIAWTQTITPKTPLGTMHVVHLVAMVLAALLAQIGVNLLNDYYDYQRGVDTSNALGPGALIQQGLIKPTSVLKIGLVFLGFGAVIGLLVALTSGPLVMFFGLLALACAYFYSATKKPLTALGLGELAALLVYGPLLTLGTYMVQMGGQFSLDALFYGLSLGLLAAAAIHANNIRDIEGDEHAGRKTLAILLGMRWSRFFYIVFIMLAYAIIVFKGVLHGAPHLTLIALWSLPGAVVVITGAARAEVSVSFHSIMLQTIKLLVFFTCLLVAALIVSSLIPVLPLIPQALLKL